jgi:signal transduction histidine kinase
MSDPNFLASFQNYPANSNAGLSPLNSGQVLGLLGTVMVTTPLYMCFISPDLKYVMASHSVAQALGVSPQKLVGISPFQDNPRLEERLRPILQQVMETGQPFNAQSFDLPYPSFSSPKISESFWNVSYIPVYDQNRQVLGVLVIADEVTEQVLQERELEHRIKQEAARTRQFETILNSLSEGVVVLDRNTQLLLSNPVASRIAGRTLVPGESGGGVLQNRRHLDGSPMSPEETTGYRAVKGENVSNLRYLVEGPDAQDQIISASGAPIYNEAGEIEGSVVIFHDVTQEEQHRRELEEAHHVTEELQNSLLDMAEATTGLTTIEQLLERFVEVVPVVTGCDRASVHLYDSATEELLPKANYGLAAEVKAQWMKMTARRMRTAPFDEPVFVKHEPFVLDYKKWQEQNRQQGREVPNPYNVKSMLMLPMVYKSEILGLVTLDYSGEAHEFSPHEIRVLEGIAHLTAIALENLRLLQEVNQAKALREANRLKDEFISTVAHELRNPLTAVQGYTQMTRRRLHRAGIDENILLPFETIIEQTQRMARLVDDLLDLSRIETNRLQLKLAPANLHDQLKRTVETYSATATRHKFLFEPEPIVNLADYLAHYDRSRLDQVIDNLLANAIKYSPQGGQITIRLSRESPAEFGGSVFHLTVQDQGIGIPNGQQEALFNRFFRTSNSRESGLPGLGLGLYICHQIIQLHGGKMWAESPGEGQGSIFHLTLPVTSEKLS